MRVGNGCGIPRIVLGVLLCLFVLSCNEDQNRDADDDDADDDTSGNSSSAAVGLVAGYAVIVGTDDSLYVTGDVEQNEEFGLDRKCLFRVAADGTLMWKRCMDEWDYGGSILGLAASGEVYFISSQCTSWENYGWVPKIVCYVNEVVAAKYTADGTEKWQTVARGGQDNGLGELFDLWAFTADDSGRVFAVTYSSDPPYTFSQLVGLRFGADGALEPHVQVEIEIDPDSVAVDPNGNVVSAGVEEWSNDISSPAVSVTSRTQSDFAESLWSISRYFPPGTSRSLSGRLKTASDSSGDVFLLIPLESKSEPVEYSCLLSKYDGNGKLLWSVEQEECYPTDVVIDATGAAYIYGCVDFEYEIPNACFVTKYSGDGVLLWNTTISTDDNHFCHFYAAAVDSAGNSYFAGSHIASIDSDGNTRWFQSFSDGDAFAVTAGQNGELFVAGASGSSRGTVVTKFSGSGEILWVSEFDANTP